MNKEELIEAVASLDHPDTLFPKEEIPHSLTGDKVRQLLNALVKRSTIYLECGVYCGGTFNAAMYKNNHITKAVAIDSWAETFGITTRLGIKPRTEFMNNVAKYFPKGVPFQMIEADHWAVTSLDCKPDLFFYDGAHDSNSQEKALTHFGKMCADTFVYVVDDFDWPKVVVGTNRGLEHFEVLDSYYLTTNKPSDAEHFWNGIYVALLKQKP